MTHHSTIKGLAASLLILTAGCVQPTELEDHWVIEAWLSDVVLADFALIGGGKAGSAELHIVDGDGEESAYVVELGGSSIGFGFDMGTSLGVEEHVPLHLPGGILGTNLLGKYRGLGWGFQVGVGADGRNLQNDYGVEIEKTLFSAGVSVFVGHEVLAIRLDNDHDLCDGIDDSGDPDGDGICSDRDSCPFDEFDDSDLDGVCDSDDVCMGHDDAGPDKDHDGIPNACDQCRGDDALGDTDQDGICDDRDNCPEDPRDTDGDGVCDSRDRCEGFDDGDDSDNDGVPNGCDECHGDDSYGDPDHDGICSDLDGCPDRFDDGADSDGDGIGDVCDRCLGVNTTGDFDGDGICTDLDCDDQVATITDVCEDAPDTGELGGGGGGYSEATGSGCSHTGGPGPAWLVFATAFLLIRGRGLRPRRG